MRKGFTLVEVLATFVLLAIVLPIALWGSSLALSVSARARHTTEATSLGQAKLNEIVQTGAAATATTSGDFGPDHAEYRWSCQSVPRDYGLNEVDLRVSWIERGQERALNLSTLSYDSSAVVTQ
jgi:prepilin-type N-terminal cleavage/methylation domain-containing protein